jgi:hypothetical protein
VHGEPVGGALYGRAVRAQAGGEASVQFVMQAGANADRGQALAPAVGIGPPQDHELFGSHAVNIGGKFSSQQAAIHIEIGINSIYLAPENFPLPSPLRCYCAAEEQ